MGPREGLREGSWGRARGKAVEEEECSVTSQLTHSDPIHGTFQATDEQRWPRKGDMQRAKGVSLGRVEKDESVQLGGGGTGGLGEMTGHVALYSSINKLHYSFSSLVTFLQNERLV